MVDTSRERTGPASAPGAADEREPRSVAQLKMLHSLAAQLNRLTDVKEIADAITVELRTIVDYHNCRVYLLAEDGETLEPIAFRGELTEYEGETYEELVTNVGEGITGHVAETRLSFYTPNADQVDFAVQIAGTGEVLESMLAVPMLFGDRVIGVIVLSSLGYDQFDLEDMRLLEVLASHAGVAFENARLFQREREAAETASALLGLSQAMTGLHDLDGVLARTVAAIPPLIPCFVVGAYVRTDHGQFALAAARGDGADRLRADPHEIDALTASEFLRSLEHPFVLTRAILDGLPEPYRSIPDVTQALVAPLRWEPDGFAAIVTARTDVMPPFGDRDLRLARGIADITSLALGAARRVHELERFHELVDSLEATFWEVDPATLTFSFLSSRATTMLGRPLLGPDDRPEHWGDHVVNDDRGSALAAVRAAIEDGGDRNIEYRARGPGGEVLWLRDLVHVVRDAHGDVTALRGLMVDITERKRAEQALRRSERKYSEAFRREREAAQRLRALDDMKNTFLEAVSHDLRTPLTSILGSALTLEHAGRISTEDGQDLVRRIAANARKLERLLSDLLDLDRLQRGIVSPQRRPTDLGALVRQTVEDSDLLSAHPVELDAPTIEISIDAAKVERVVENLLANAARHTRPGTKIWVRVERADEGALITVEDEGPGVPADLREAIFEPFRQGDGPKSHSPGVGVGLSLVARFAELHGGRAWVEDRPGGGAAFKVALPG